MGLTPERSCDGKKRDRIWFPISPHNSINYEIPYQQTAYLTEMREWSYNPANIYLMKVSDRNTRKTCEICSKLTVKILERRQRFSDVFKGYKNGLLG